MTCNPESPGRTAGDILDRIILALNLSSDGDISRTFNIGRSTVGGWRANDRRPYELCVDLRDNQGLSLEWLLTGEGPMRRPPPGSAAPQEFCGVAQPVLPWPSAAQPSAGPLVPPGLERRVEALAGVLAQLDPAHCDEILAHALSRATDAQRLAVLEQALLDLAPARKRA